MHEITIAEANDLAKRVLTKHGMTGSDAELVAQHLVFSELRGYPGHGLRRLGGIVESFDTYPNDTDLVATVKLPGISCYDARQRSGIAAITDALNDAAPQLSDAGAMVVSVSNFVGSSGSLGNYGAVLAGKGVAAITMCNSEYAIAPCGSSRAVLGTNPICFSAPGKSYPFVGDFATAAWSYGAIKEAGDRGEKLPDGVVQTENGRPSNDPADADNGSQLPMAGHKGYALGLGIEMFAGGLIGAKSGRDAVKGSDGFFALLVRLNAVREENAVLEDFEKLFAEIKKGPQSGEDPIRIPGERASKESAAKSTIHLSESTFNLVHEL